MIIVAAAVRSRGKVYQGKRHAEIMRQIWDEHGPVKIRQQDQGFLTDSGIFISRCKAAQIAYLMGQTATFHDVLLSEHLW